MTTSCFICGEKIRRQMSFNPAGFNTESHAVLRKWLQRWSSSFCTLLTLKDEKVRDLLKTARYCLTCHQLICEVEFISSAISRLEKKLSQIQEHVMEYLRQGYSNPANEYRHVIKQIIFKDQMEEVPDIKIKQTGDEDGCNSSVVENLVDTSGPEDSGGFEPDDDDPTWTPDPPKKVVLIRSQPKSTKPRRRKCYPRESRQPIRVRSKVPPKLPGSLCTFCHQTFSDRNEKERHRRKCHKRVKPTVVIPPTCHFCGKTFATLDEVKSHEILHDPVTLDNPFSCILCPTQLACEADLRKHVLDEHENKTKLTCDLCDKLFSSKATLRLHIKGKHLVGVTKVLKCPECSYVTRFPSHLGYHQLLHGERLLTCKVENCTASFHNKRKLRAHETRSHGTGGRFPCVLCPKVFNHGGALKNHQLHHSSMRPYMCEQCPSTFKSQTNLRTHRKVHAVGKASGTNLKLQNPRKARLVPNFQLPTQNDLPPSSSI